MNVDHQESLEAEVARLRQENERLERVADYQMQAANKALRKADAAERELARLRTADPEREAVASRSVESATRIWELLAINAQMTRHRDEQAKRAEAAEAELARLRQDVKIEAHARQRNHERAESAERELALCRRDREEAERLYDRCEIRYMAAERELARLREGLRRIVDSEIRTGKFMRDIARALLAEDGAT